MTEKRFKITKSKLIKNAHVIVDGKKQFTFPTLVGDNRGLIAYKQALNKLSEENKPLKKELKTLWKYLKPLNNLARDYHLTYEQLYEITSEAIEKGDVE